MDDEDLNEQGFEDDEPLPGKRDTRIFNRKKEPEKKEEFDEDVFV
jgi:hypothetical protein